MRKNNIILKIISVVLILTSFIKPINASSLTDSALKVVLKTIEDIERYIDESKYPGYKEKMITLKKENPNWEFTIYYTGLDWKTVLYNETKGLHSRC